MTTAADMLVQGGLPDYLIVGGGTSGCVLAARLTESPDVRVLLVEAGPDLTEESQPADIRSGNPSRAFFTREFFFDGLMARFGAVPTVPDAPRPAAKYEQARVLGGGSAINGMLGNRGAPADYDEWEALGAEGWNWASTLPYFRKLERDLDVSGDLHGADGPVPISRPDPATFCGFVRGTRDMLLARGVPTVEDQNGDWGDGVMRVTTTISERAERASAAVCYLTPEVRRRPNLVVVTGRSVNRLMQDAGTVTGAEIAGPDGPVRIAARETIVCCGAINTPALLQRSGFGPADLLTRTGVPVVRDIAGVGQNLQEHPALGISCFIRPGNRHSDSRRHHTQVHYRFSSGLEGCPETDMHMAVLARSAWHDVGEQLGTYYLWINKSYSTGHVAIASPEADKLPDVDFRLLSDQRDLQRMRDGFRRVASVALDPALDAVRAEVFPTIFSDRVRQVSRPGQWNAFQTAVFARVLDFAGFARGALIRRFIAPYDIRELLADDAALDAYLHKAIVGVWHCVGTCRMGRADDPAAVTASDGRVHGVPGLRIGDASLMPTVPCANTNIPTFMLAERIADLIRSESRAAPAGLQQETMP
ncbi:GMC family oxidoreductase [Aquibium oceanicum]|nr:GMC family oxidoreductase N-terminal domain-containing protein [Aquibium oceanicum]